MQIAVQGCCSWHNSGFDSVNRYGSKPRVIAPRSTPFQFAWPQDVWVPPFLTDKGLFFFVRFQTVFVTPWSLMASYHTGSTHMRSAFFFSAIVTLQFKNLFGTPWSSLWPAIIWGPPTDGQHFLPSSILTQDLSEQTLCHGCLAGWS
jgi:hypothetical protein